MNYSIFNLIFAFAALFHIDNFATAATALEKFQTNCLANGGFHIGDNCYILSTYEITNVDTRANPCDKLNDWPRGHLAHVWSIEMATQITVIGDLPSNDMWMGVLRNDHIEDTHILSRTGWMYENGNDGFYGPIPPTLIELIVNQKYSRADKNVTLVHANRCNGECAERCLGDGWKVTRRRVFLCQYASFRLYDENITFIDELSDVINNTSPYAACSSFCIKRKPCMAFSTSTDLSYCALHYGTPDMNTESLVQINNVQLWMKSSIPV